MDYPKYIRWFFLLLLLIPTQWLAAQELKVYSELRRQQTLSPGETYQGSIRMENIGEQPMVVKVFQQDYFYDVQQRKVYNTRIQAERSNRSWITFKPDYLELQPNREAIVDFIVTVPHSTLEQPLEGTYWSMLVVQPAPLEETDTPLMLIKGQKIRRQIQYGIQMVTHIANTGVKDISVEDTWVEADEEGKTNFYAVLRNKGTLGFKSDIAIELYNEQGQSNGKIDGMPAFIYPGCAVLKKIELPELASGTYPSLLLVDGGADALFGMQVNLDIHNERVMR